MSPYLQPGAEPVAGYTLVRRLGAGGFGEVWEARAPGEVRVALKFIRLETGKLVPEQRALEVIREIRHPHLLDVQFAIQRKDYLILAAPLCDQTLWDRFRACQGEGLPGLPPDELLRYMEELAQAVDFLNEPRHPGGHGRLIGVQHRDIKPHNVFLVGGSTRLADFGLAKILEASHAVHSGGMTPAYAAPELFSGRVARQTDQYALAVTYCELRCGRMPFSGSTEEIIDGHLHRPPDLSGLSPSECEVVARALLKRPEARWPTCRAFVQALVAVVRTEAPAGTNQDGWEAASGSIPRGPRILSNTDAWPLPTPASGPGHPGIAAAGPGARRSRWVVAAGLAALAIATASAILLGTRRVVPPDPLPRELTNSVGMKLVLIPAGVFQMGSPDFDKDAHEDERPQHRVQITQPFYLGATEVTVGQFRRFVEATDYRTDAERDRKGGWGWDEQAGKDLEDPKYTWRSPGFEQTDEHPVVNVSWNDAMAFCTWLGRQEGWTYRLPTEAEWEYACRAGTTTRFECGDDPESLVEVGNVKDGTAKARYPNWETIVAMDGYVFTSPVGRFRANGFGLFDMHGNVWEWCSDWYDQRYYKLSPATDPPGPLQATARVRRGGCYDYNPRGARSAFRNWTVPEGRHNDLGFRVARGQSRG